MYIIDFKNKLALKRRLKEVSFFNSIKHYFNCFKVALYKSMTIRSFVSVICLTTFIKELIKKIVNTNKISIKLLTQKKSSK